MNTYPFCETCGKLLPLALRNGYMPTVTPLLGRTDISITMSDHTTLSSSGFIGMVSVCQCSDVPQAFYDAFAEAEDWM